MELPFEIFVTVIGVSIALAIFGFIRNPQIPAMLVFAGIFILTIAVATTSIVFGQLIDNIDSSVTPAFVTQSFHYNLGSGNTDVILDNISQNAVGEDVVNTNSVLYGKSVQCIEIPLRKNGSPTGNLTVGVMNVNSLIINTFGTMDASTLTTSLTPYTFCKENNQEAVLGVNDRIGVKYLLGNGVNNVVARYQTGNPIDGTNTVLNAYQTSWLVGSANDVVMRLYDEIPIEAETDETYTYTPNTYEFTELPKVMFMLIGVFMMLGGAIMVGKGI